MGFQKIIIIINKRKKKLPAQSWKIVFKKFNEKFDVILIDDCMAPQDLTTTKFDTLFN